MTYPLIHSLVAVLAIVMALCVFPQNEAHGFIAGTIFITASILTTALILYWMILNKNLALLVGVIVIKWPFLIYIVFQLTKRGDLPLLHFAGGTLTMVVSALIWHFIANRD